jgi:hypothetical protein
VFDYSLTVVWFGLVWFGLAVVVLGVFIVLFTSRLASFLSILFFQ